MSHDIRKAVQVHSLKLDHYLHEKVYAKVDEFLHQKNPMHIIDEAHCRGLAELLHSYRYHYARNIVKLYFSSTLNPESAMYAAAVHTVTSMKLMKDRYYIVIPDDCHRLLSLKVLRDEDGVKCAAEPLRMRYTFRVDGKSIFRAQAINLKKLANTSMAIVGRKETFTDTMQILLSYARVFEEGYGVHLVYTCILGIL